MGVSYTRNREFSANKPTDSGVVSRQLLETFQAIRQHSLNLASHMSSEDMAVQSLPESSPIKWHLAKSTWYFEKYLLLHFVKDYLPFNPNICQLFDHSLGLKVSHDQRGHITRPNQALVRQYRTHVDTAMTALINNMPKDAYPILEAALHHEQHIQEQMLADIKHVLGTNPFHPAYISKSLAPADQVDTLKMLELRAGMVDIGHPGLTFCYENELPKHRMFLQPFAIADRKITNGEYMAFVKAGGYSEERWWMEEGVEWCKREQITAPLYWRLIDNVWFEYTLHGLQPLDLHRPVCHVSYFEADAFARFSGARLPTEFEWEFAAHAIIPEFNVVNGMPALDEKNPAVELHPRGAPKVTGLKQLFTDAWEWTSSSYALYPGVRKKFDYTINNIERQMVNQYVLRGGSAITPPGHTRMTFRNFYPTHTRWQFSGIRLARSVF